MRRRNSAYRLGQAYWSLADYGRAIACMERSVACLEGELIRERFGMSGFPSVLSREWLVWMLAEQGTFTEGMQRGEEMLRLAEAIDHPFSLCGACWGVGYVYLRKGDLSKAIVVLDRGHDVCQVWHIPFLFPWVAAPLGAAYALAGRLVEALPLLEQAVEQAASIRLTVTQALSLAEELGMRPLQAHCHLGLGTLYAKIRQREQARTELSMAIELYRAMDMTVWLPQAEGELAQMEGR